MTAERNGADKPVMVTTPLDALSGIPNRRDISDFNKIISEDGNEVLIEKSLMCPCRVKGSGSPLSDCKNCQGSGWFYVDKSETRLIIQNMNKTTKYSRWTEEDRGKANVTGRGVDKLGFRDRITVLDLQAIYAQNLYFKDFKGSKFAFMLFNPLVIYHSYAFVNSNVPLQKLEYNTDFSITGNKLVITNGALKNKDNLCITIRYAHHPVYEVLEVTRDLGINRKKNCAGDDDLQNNPISALARKIQFNNDSPDFNGESVFDNTDYTSTTNGINVL